MTTTKAERDWDRGMNEGGDGYNPYRARREAREAAAAAARPRSRGERIYSLLRELAIANGSIARESGTFDADRVAALRAQIDALEAEEAAEFAAIWTREVTIARRAAWNARVRAGEFGKIGSGKIDYDALRKAQEAQGWTVDDLKRAIALHKLPKA